MCIVKGSSSDCVQAIVIEDEPNDSGVKEKLMESIRNLKTNDTELHQSWLKTLSIASARRLRDLTISGSSLSHFLTFTLAS